MSSPKDMTKMSATSALESMFDNAVRVNQLDKISESMNDGDVMYAIEHYAPLKHPSAPYEGQAAIDACLQALDEFETATEAIIFSSKRTRKRGFMESFTELNDGEDVDPEDEELKDKDVEPAMEDDVDIV